MQKPPDITSSYLSEDDLGFAESSLTSDWNALAGVWKRTIRASSSKSIPVMQGQPWSQHLSALDLALPALHTS